MSADDDNRFRPKPGRIRSDALKAGHAKSFLTKVRKIARQQGAASGRVSRGSNGASGKPGRNGAVASGRGVKRGRGAAFVRSRNLSNGWWYCYEAYAPAIFVEGAVIAASGGLVSIAVSIGLSMWRAKEAKNVATYGSARWASPEEVKTAGLRGPDGVLLGRLDRDYLRHDGPEHVLCFAPTRSGKGVGLVVPTLLTWPGSVIVHDIKGENWTLPGQIVAQVTENVYDSPTGRLLLIPQGTRLIGQYDSGVGFGQRRVLLAWTRLIFPNGRSIVLERQPGADAQGYAGLEDGVDHHWWDLAKAAGLSTLLSVGAQAGSSGEQGDLVRALRQGASDGISRTGRQVVGRQLDIAPTLTIRPGFPVRVIVGRDLILEPYGAVP